MASVEGMANDYKPDGKPRRKVLYGKTRVEVSAALKKVLRDQQLGLSILTDRQTLGPYLDHWLEDIVRPKISS